MAKNATAQEVAAARAFLRFIGANWHSNQLVLAVISWARYASGRLSGSLGHNPFRLYKLSNGNYVTYRYKGSTGKAASFGTLEQAFVAAAKALKYMASKYPKADPATFNAGGAHLKAYSFKEVLLSFKSGQAGEVLTAISLSNFDTHHYGLTVDSKGNITKNNLLRVYNSYDGLITPEAEAAAAAERAKQKAEQAAWERQERARKAALAKLRRRPKQLNPPAPPRDYLDPYAVGRSYSERHEPYELPE